MHATLTLAKAANCSFFEVCDRDADEVVDLMIFYLEIAATAKAENKAVTARPRGKEERVRVNDKTATGGWF